MQNHTRYLCSLLLVLLLTACQSLPQGFSPQQVRVLQQEGFEPLGEDWVLNLSVLILFGFDEASLNQQSQQEVQRLGRTLLDIGIDKIRIEGHADTIGDPGYNLQLSQQRADAVGREIEAAGMQPSAIQAQGMGSAFPMASNDTLEGRAQNRRVTLIVTP